MAAGDFLPFLLMVIVQMGYAGMNILSSLAMDSGMSPFVHVAYRQFFATIFIAPFAFFFERNIRPKMTRRTFFMIFLSSIFGATLNQTFYFIGLHHSTPTIACALSNLLPAVTFLLAVPFGMESGGIRKKSSQAKIIGTLVCVGGAMLLSFYHGETIVGKSRIHWKYAEKMDKGSSIDSESNNIVGPLLVILSTAAWAAWFVIQARTSRTYPAPYTTSALMCLMASFQCGIIGLIMEHKKSAWSLSPSIRVISSLYAGAVCTALAFGLMSWCIQKKGPLYVSVFSPLLLVIVAVLSWGLLGEKLYIGTAIGSVLIVLGLYAVLWGKNKEKSVVNNVEDDVTKEIQEEKETDMEMQIPNGNLHAQM